MKKILPVWHHFVFGHQATETAARQPASEGDWPTDQDIQCTSCQHRSGTELFSNFVVHYCSQVTRLNEKRQTIGSINIISSVNIVFLCVFLAAEKDTERAFVKWLLRCTEQLPEDPTPGSRQRERVCGPSQSQLQGVSE